MELVPDAEVRVLVVDDQDLYLRAMMTVIEATDGFVVVGSATTGEGSLVAAAELQPQLVLMDVNLPGIDGTEASRQLTAVAGGPVVVLLSTYDADQFDIADSGAAAYVPKAELGPDRLEQAWAEAARSGTGSRKQD